MKHSTKEVDVTKLDFLELRRLMERSHLEIIKRTLNKKDKQFSGSATIHLTFDAKSPLQLNDLKSLITKRLTSDLVGLSSSFGYGGNISVTEANTKVDSLEEVTQNVSKSSDFSADQMKLIQLRKKESPRGNSREETPTVVAS